MSKKHDADLAGAAALLISSKAGKAYGAAEVDKAVSISVSLPPAMLESLEAVRDTNKKAKQGRRTISGLIQEALEQAGY